MKKSKTELLEMFVESMLNLIKEMEKLLEEMLSAIRTPDGD